MVFKNAFINVKGEVAGKSNKKLLRIYNKIRRSEAEIV